ncbi:MAG TPA: hypothetical protein VJ719_03580 [Chthoniobacterales bacterium]|nr:hypothetical protein [Chthoniobacterales bacterium]
MKKSLGIYLAVVTGLILFETARATDVVPKRTEFSRYQSMLDNSPFAVATAVALPAATPSFAKDLYIANAARTAEGDLITLNSATDKNFKEFLSTKGPNEHGYGIANIEWSDRMGATKATISKDGQFSTVTFNQAFLSVTPGAAGAPAPGFVQPQPQAQPQPANVYPQMQTAAPTPVTRPGGPNMPTPPPRVRGVIPRNPSSAGQVHQQPGVVATPPPLPPNVPVED